MSTSIWSSAVLIFHICAAATSSAAAVCGPATDAQHRAAEEHEGIPPSAYLGRNVSDVTKIAAELTTWGSVYAVGGRMISMPEQQQQWGQQRTRMQLCSPPMLASNVQRKGAPTVESSRSPELLKRSARRPRAAGLGRQGRRRAPADPVGL